MSNRRYLYDDGIGFVELYDFSRANVDNQSRINAITKVASICVGKDEATKPEKLFKRLSKESSMLPSSSFEFCPICLNMSQIEHIVNSKIDINYSYVAHIIKYGELIDDSKYLLTNLRALIYDVGLDNTLNNYYSEPNEIQVIKDNFFVFKMKIPIFVARQTQRHRVNFQELCISGNSLITTSKGKRKIEDLYNQQYKYKNHFNNRLPKIKTYDFDLNRFIYVPINEVFYTGKKKVFKIKIQYGTNGKFYEIETSKNHKFLTINGWKKLKDIKQGDFLAINGQKLYKNKEWLKEKKEYYLEKGIGLKDWVKIEGLNYNTIRTWLRKHNIQYTQKEASSCYDVWNKGIKGKNSHCFGRIHSDNTRQMISKKLSKPLGTTKGGWRKRASSYWEAEFRRTKILDKYNHKCNYCGSTKELELDHIKSVSLYPKLAFDEDNMQILCKKCHKSKSIEEYKITKQTIKYGMVISIKEVGIVDTYDIEVAHKDQNYVANGIVVHNSRRFVSGSKIPFEFYEPDDSMEDLNDNLVLAYNKLVKQGMKPERARAVLPQSLYTTIWSAWNKSQLDNFFKLRIDKHAQQEIRLLAENMRELIKW